MQQFTNLTINDKTNKTKKTALSKSDVDRKIVSENKFLYKAVLNL